ncbi:pentatricopeptide repeat (PPR) superfamily protein isoform X2 [Tasmannia lanceolata]|uniref:pentatricopeptide repeat (PPR) superfamily protein isoform X2 n=1 Tax=Tasmannia lanceolata TaxID=3420 RepID=UPI0040647677
MIFDWMQMHGKINVGSYSSFIKFMGMSRNPIKALQVYNSIDDETTRNNVSIYNAVLGCLIKNGKFDTGIKLFYQMKKDGLTPDAVTYSSLLAGCIKVKHGYSMALDLVKELKDNGLQMDSVIYGTLLAICASNNLCKEAENFLEQMKDEGYVPNIFHYSSLLNAYSVEGNHTKADKLLEDMKSAGLVPNKVILTTLLKVYVRGGLFEKSRELLVKLDALGHAEDEIPYCLLMDGLAKAGHIDEAEAIFEEMKNKNVKSDGYAHSIMISAYCRSGLSQEAKQLARDFEACYDKYDLVMLNTLLRAYCRAGEMDSVMQLLRKMDELTISPDWNTFHILIKYFSKEKLYQLAYRTVADMHSKGHQLDEELCSSLIFQLGYAGATSEAFSVYSMLRYSKRTLCKALHERMLNILVTGGLHKEAYVVMKDNAQLISKRALKKFSLSFMKSGNINLINDVIKASHNSGRRIDQEVFGLAVSRYIGQLEKKELLLQMLEWMTGQGYVVDSSTRNVLLKNSHLFGRQLIAEILSKQHTMSRKLKAQEKEDE